MLRKLGLRGLLWRGLVGLRDIRVLRPRIGVTGVWGLLRRLRVRRVLRLRGHVKATSTREGMFDPHRALSSVHELAHRRFAGRRLGTRGHDLARQWTEARLDSWGLPVRRHPFSYSSTIVEVRRRPRVDVRYGRGNGSRPLEYRTDFAEHPSSAAARGTFRGPLRRGKTSSGSRGSWLLANSTPGTASLGQQASDGESAGALGLVVPFTVPPKGVIFKQLFAGDPLALPTLFVRRQLLGNPFPERLEADLDLRRAPLRGTNLIAELPGSDPSLATRPLLVGAHFDAVGDDPQGLRFPGASDNASGLAVVLEAARVCRGRTGRFARPVWFAAFDAEETGANGSRALAAELQHAGMDPLVANVDIAARVGLPVTVEGSANATGLFAALDAVGRRLGILLRQGPMQSDNRQFAARGFASVGLGSGGIGYHTPQDVPERVQLEALRRMGKLLVGLIEEVAGRSSLRSP